MPSRLPTLIFSFLALTLVLLSTLMGGGAVAATRLTPANSISFPFAASSTETFAGTDCGATATVVKRYPAGSKGIKMAEPKVGDRDKQGGATQVTSVSVAGTVVTITVRADGPSICDPDRTGVPAGEPVHWKATYPIRAEYRRRVQTTMRVFYESYLFGAKWKLRPKTIRDSRRGGPPGERVTGIRWKRFGGKTAVGSGRLRQDYCRRGDNCPQNGKRVRLVASKAAYCKDSDKIEYLRLRFYIGGMLKTDIPIKCSG